MFLGNIIDDLTGQLRRIPPGLEPAHPSNSIGSGQGRRPKSLGSESVRGDDTEPGDHDRRAHSPAPGPASTIADWNPPNPLPTVSTTSVRHSRAVSGT
ncbi:hypothetical protein GCM10027088_67700 [Nocardia goodfellowii]